jgi:hypothetical protein
LMAFPGGERFRRHGEVRRVITMQSQICRGAPPGSGAVAARLKPFRRRVQTTVRSKAKNGSPTSPAW